MKAACGIATLQLLPKTRTIFKNHQGIAASPETVGALFISKSRKEDTKMNKKFTARILSMLLAMLMLVSMLPTSVFCGAGI